MNSIKKELDDEDKAFLEYFELKAVFDFDREKLHHLIKILKTLAIQRRLEEWKNDRTAL